MENFERYGLNQKSIEETFNNILKIDSEKGVVFNLSEIEEKLAKIVDSFTVT